MTFYDQIDANKRKSWLIMAAFIGFITLAVYFMARGLGFSLSYVGLAFIFSGFTSLLSYYYSDKLILMLSGAREASRKQDFHFYTVTENLCLAAGIPKPRLYVIEDSAMNAFATGRDPKHAVVCATRGMLEKLNRTELEGVIAHELSHIRNYDTRLMSIVVILVGMLALIADWFLRMSFWGGGRRRRDEREEGGQIQALLFIAGLILAFLSPLIAQLIQLAISRRREFLADASGVGLTKYPEGLARALEKLADDKEPLEAANKATAHLYIHSPFGADIPRSHFSGSQAVGMFANLFSTHPPIAERIKLLRKMR